jgi:hypothetical protein
MKSMTLHSKNWISANILYTMNNLPSISDIDAIHDFMIANGMLAPISTIEKHIKTLENYMNHIEIVKNYIARIFIVCKHIEQHRICVNKSITPSAPIILEKSSKLVAPNLFISVLEVESSELVPSTPLCWIKDKNEFAIRIDGHLISGNIGEIYTKKDIKDHQSLYKKQDGILNFAASSWLYTNQPLTHNNRLMRHIGNRSTLYNDIRLYKHSNISYERLCAQLMHDILVFYVSK